MEVFGLCYAFCSDHARLLLSACLLQVTRWAEGTLATSVSPTSAWSQLLGVTHCLDGQPQIYFTWVLKGLLRAAASCLLSLDDMLHSFGGSSSGHFYAMCPRLQPDRWASSLFSEMWWHDYQYWSWLAGVEPRLRAGLEAGGCKSSRQRIRCRMPFSFVSCKTGQRGSPSWYGLIYSNNLYLSQVYLYMKSFSHNL